MRLPPPSPRLQPPLQPLSSFPSHFTAVCLFVFIMCFTSLLPAVVFAWVAESGGKGQRCCGGWLLGRSPSAARAGLRSGGTACGCDRDSPRNIGWPTWCFLCGFRPIIPIAMATQKLSFPCSWAPRLSALTWHRWQEPSGCLGRDVGLGTHGCAHDAWVPRLCTCVGCASFPPFGWEPVGAFAPRPMSCTSTQAPRGARGCEERLQSCMRSLRGLSLGSRNLNMNIFKYPY